MVEQRQQELGVARADLLKGQGVRVASGFSFGAQALEVVVQIAGRHGGSKNSSAR